MRPFGAKHLPLKINVGDDFISILNSFDLRFGGYFARGCLMRNISL